MDTAPATMPLRKAPAADLRRHRPLHALLGTALALAVVAAAFVVPYRSTAEAATMTEDDAPFVLEDVLTTLQSTPPPPPPPAPPPPVEVPDEVPTEDVIADFEFDPEDAVAPPAGPPAPPVEAPNLTVPEPPPPPVVEVPQEDYILVAEVQPELIGGIAALQARVEYPEMARRAGVEGRVVVQFVVDERGNVVNPVAIASPSDLLSEAAVRAVRESQFTPGQQRGRPVRVRFAVPVTFRLR